MPQRCFDAVLKAVVELCHDALPRQQETGLHMRFEAALHTSPVDSGNFVLSFTAQGLALPPTADPLQELKGKRKLTTSPQRDFPACTKPFMGIEETQAAPLTLAALELEDSKHGRNGVCLRDHWLTDISFELFCFQSICCSSSTASGLGGKHGHYKIKARIQHLQNCALKA